MLPNRRADIGMRFTCDMSIDHAKPPATFAARMSSLNKKFPRLLPEPIRKGMKVADLIDTRFQGLQWRPPRGGLPAFHGEDDRGRRHRRHVAHRRAHPGRASGSAAIVPLMKAGFVDWIISTGANLYHDLHYGLGMQLYAGSPFLNDVELRRDGIIRIYDVLFDYDVLLDTDAFVRQVIQGAGISAHDGHRRVSLSARQVRA